MSEMSGQIRHESEISCALSRLKNTHNQMQDATKRLCDNLQPALAPAPDTGAPGVPPPAKKPIQSDLGKELSILSDAYQCRLDEINDMISRCRL